VLKLGHVSGGLGRGGGGSGCLAALAYVFLPRTTYTAFYLAGKHGEVGHGRERADEDGRIVIPARRCTLRPRDRHNPRAF